MLPTKGLVYPNALAFLPDGSILIAERAGRLRIVRDGVFDPQPVAGMPPVLHRNLKGLNHLALHPRFAENHLIYFTYYKPVAGSADMATAILARARFDGAHALSDVKEIFATDQATVGPSAARFVFGRDGKIYLAIGIPIPADGRPGVATATDAQQPNSYFGKVLRLNDEGTAPPDNPFAGRAGYKPEIYALGIRNAMSMVLHPATGEIWETENGPQGGDELNIIRAGCNYGWPVISYDRSYGGDVTGDTGPSSPQPSAAGMEQPLLMWAPSPALSGMAFYTGNRFPQWKGHIFIGVHELQQRIREVRQGPDGLLYLLTDAAAGALLRVEPVQP